MKYYIEIEDQKNTVSTINLRDILKSIETKGAMLNWAILDLWAVGDLGNDKSMPDFEKEIRNAPSGLKLTWEELTRLSNKFIQVIDILIIGVKNEENLKKYKDDSEIYSYCDISIESCDSSFWKFYSNDIDDYNRINKQLSLFKITKIDVNRLKSFS